MNLPRRIANAVSRFALIGTNARSDAKVARNAAVWLAAASLVLCCVFSFSQSNPASQPAQSSSPKTASTAPSDKAMLTDAQMSKMSSDQLAHYVFEHHGCNKCHTLGANGKLGFTERGTEVGKGFVGCISLLTSMNVIAQVKPGDRSTDEKQKAATFQEFGCTTCHQIVPGKLGLTTYGTKLKSLHMACTDVERILSSQR